MAYNVLIVDDSTSMRSIIAKALRLSGIDHGDVHMASDGVEALGILESSWVDLVLADLNMPNMGGIELVERMQQKGITAKTPVVIVSTEARHDVIQALMTMGAAAFLRKPFAPEQLSQLVESVLSASAPKPAEEMLATSFFEALEGFAMLVANPVEPTAPYPPLALVAEVAFVGPGTVGEVIISAEPSACDGIAASATGEDQGDGADALAELANMTAGQVVERIEGGPFALHPPKIARCTGEDAWNRIHSAASHAAFDVEGVTLLVAADVRRRW